MIELVRIDMSVGDILLVETPEFVDLFSQMGQLYL